MLRLQVLCFPPQAKTYIRYKLRCFEVIRYLLYNIKNNNIIIFIIIQSTLEIGVLWDVILKGIVYVFLG